VGALEAKKQFMFPGFEMEGYELPAVENSYYASRVDALMSHGAETFFCYKPKYAAVDGYTTSKDWWLNLVPDEVDRLMFHRAHRWEDGTPNELEPFLSKDVDEAWRL